MLIEPGLRSGAATPPPSKSHLHRLLIADFLAGDYSRMTDDPSDSEDVKATKRCLAALKTEEREVELDCGESGSTLRFMSPVAAALGKKATFKKAGRLASRPALEYSELNSGLHMLEGNISSQFVTGLLFALPIIEGDSQIRFLSKLESRGYVDMTLEVIRGAGIQIDEVAGGFDVRGGQRYQSQRDVSAEGDWSGAAFWYCANAIGNQIEVNGMNPESVQPDRRVLEALTNMGSVIDMSQFPDSFPILTVAAACTEGVTDFVGIKRLRIKESDRVAAMADVLNRFGTRVEVEDNLFRVHGTNGKLRAGAFTSYGDHRIAMSIAIAATRADGAVEIDNAACAAKSYPTFFDDFGKMSISRQP